MDLAEPSSWQWIWLVAMVVFGVGEMAMAGTFFLAPFALGAAVASALAFAGVSVGVEWVVFLAVSVVSFLAMRPVAKRLDARDLADGFGANRLIGQRARVVEAIGPGHAPGMVIHGGEQWRAESAEGDAIAADTSVSIIEVRGTRLLVRVSENQPADPAAT